MSDHDFFKRPILNSPYEEPQWHHILEGGQPTNQPPKNERRKSDRHVTPVPKSKRGAAGSGQASLLDEEDDKYDPAWMINDIRQHVKSWRELPASADWGVTPATRRLLDYWRNHNFASIRPFFCQIEAVETIIWLTEVARGQRQYKRIWDHLEGGNAEANPNIFRLAMKMATGAGKTTVMAMLIAWQTVNAVRMPSSKNYSKGFLIIAPGITIRDRLRVLDPTDPDSYYESRELVPSDMMNDITAAKVVVANYHAFQKREKTKIAKGTRGAIEGWREEKIVTVESEGEMLRRSMGDLFNMKNIVVVNDEAHHCYREKAGTNEIAESKGDDKVEAKKNNEAARLWISGIEAIKRKIGVRAIYDLSATPFFLRGSGYREGTLFPWTVSDFSLMDAIECGIVKLPRVPILDNVPSSDAPIYRDLWKHIGKKMPRKGRSKTGGANPEVLAEVTPLITALESLYAHYEKTDAEWRAKGHDVPPVFIVVCNNTTTSQIVHDWIAGYEKPETDESPAEVRPGHLKLFSNYDELKQRYPKPRTLLIDSAQIDSGEGLDKTFRDAMAPEIEQFRREKGQREGVGGDVKITDEDLLREVMNTVGEKGRLGESIRCVVSVSMLTEGWDANTVTHILGVRAFGTQLLCEQVVGRALRRKSYELNDQDLFDVEYADIMGIPFDFTAKPTVAPPSAPKPVTRVHAMRDRAHLAIRFPRVAGYRTALPDEKITATFNEDSKLRITSELVGATKTHMSGIVGEQEIMSPEDRLDEHARPNSIAYVITKHLLLTKFQDEDGMNMTLFPQVKRVVMRWLDEGYLICESEGTYPAMVAWPGVIEKAAEKIFLACQPPARDGKNQTMAVIDSFNPEGDTRFVNFTTSKPCFITDPRKSHVSHVVEDSNWEAEMARVCEEHPHVIAYVKNQGLGLEVPYRDGPMTRGYTPDFIVRLDDGRGETDPLNLVLEVKGYRDENAKVKAQTMQELWVPGVNNLGRFGRWAFGEFTEVFGMENAFKELVDKFVMDSAKAAE